MAAEDDELFLNKSFANPYVSVPWAILSGIGAVASPGTARATSGINAGLGVGMNAERYQQEQGRRRRLGEELDKLATATKPVRVTKVGLDPETTTFSMPEKTERLSDVMPDMLAPRKEPPRFTAVEDRPIFSPEMQQYIRTVGKESPQAALSVVGSVLSKDQNRKQHSIRPGGSLVDEDGNLLYQAPAAPPRAVTPPRPVFSTQGGEAVESVFNPATQQWETSRRPVVPAPAAPARTLTPEEVSRIRSQNAVDQARIQQINSSIAIARDAKTQTVGQLGSALNALNNMMQGGMLVDNPEMEAMVKQAQTAILQELARRGGTTPRPTATPSGAQTFNELPPASQFKGRTLNNGELRSDGVNWRDRNGNIVGAAPRGPETEY